MAGVKYTSRGEEKKNPVGAPGRARNHLEEIWPAVGYKQRDLVMDAATQTGKARQLEQQDAKETLVLAFQALARRVLGPPHFRTGGICLILRDILRINLRSSKYVGNGFSPFIPAATTGRTTLVLLRHQEMNSSILGVKTRQIN